MSGVVAVGGLSGCLSQVASSVTNTAASPAAVFAGESVDWNDDDTEVTFGMSLGEPRVSRLTPVLSGGSGVLSGEVKLEAWLTSVAVSAANYNNSRSNRATVRAVDIIGDDVNEQDETFRVALELESQLQAETEAAVRSISKRSARTGRNPELDRDISGVLGDIDRTLSELRLVLERCSDEPCVAALKNVGHMESAVRRAREYVENEEWDAAINALGGDTSSPIYEGDAVGGESAIYREAIVPPNGPLSEDEREELVEYFGGEPIISERFTVCVPDAEVPGGNGGIRETLTPQRLIDYMTGRADGDGRVYSWGDADSDADGLGDCDDSGGTGEPGQLCGTTDHLAADVSGPTSTGGGLEAVRASDGTVIVVTSPPSAEGGASVLVCPLDAEAYEPDDLSDWGAASDGGDTDSQFMWHVAQVMVQPPGCPHAFPAVLCVGRGLSDDQFIYSGGWVIDEAALFENSETVLTIAGETQVVGVDALVDGECCFDYNDGVSRSLSDERARRGARIDSGSVSALADSGVLSSGGVEGLEQLIRKRPGRRKFGNIDLKHVALDAPILHLVNAERASTDVKFKAGAELSKSVN